MDANDLYAVPLERFVPERTALVKALRASGHREEATTAGRLRKPSLAAWAVNQVVRSEPDALAELLHAGDELREAQDEVFGGGGAPDALRGALERERAAVAELTSAAEDVLRSGGQTPSTAVLERVSDTLHAAALDDDAREQVTRGRLTAELRHVGFGLGEAPSAPAPTSTPRRAKKAAAKAPPKEAKDARGDKRGQERERKRAEQERKREEQERERTRQHAHERAQARRELRAAERRLRDAERAVERTAKRREEAQARFEETTAAADEARSERDAAAAAHEEAEGRLSVLED